MTIPVTCPSCQKQFRAPLEAAGRRARCKGCGEVLTIPKAKSEEAMAPIDLSGLEETESTAPPVELTADASPRCPSCHAVMPNGAVLCTSCGYHTAAQRRLKATASREAAAEGSRRMPNLDLHVMGFQLGPKFFIALAILIATTIWWITGPAQLAHVYEIASVNTTPIVDKLRIAGSDNFFSSQIASGLGARMSGAESDAPNTGTTAIPRTVGGHDQVVLIRPGQDGPQLLVRVSLSQKLLHQYKQLKNGRAYFVTSMFRLKDADGKDQPLHGHFLHEALNGRVRFDLVSGESNDVTALLPPDQEPTLREEKRERSGGISRATYAWDGSTGLSGALTATSFLHASQAEIPGISGLSATGRLSRHDDDGLIVNYVYNGTHAQVQWEGAGAEGWWATDHYDAEESINYLAKHELTLIIDAPPSEGWSLYYQDYLLADLPTHPAAANAIRVAFSPAPAQTPTTNALDDDSAPVSKTGDPHVLDYFRLIAQAHKRVKGLASVSNLQQLGIALLLYTDQNGGRLPDTLNELAFSLGGQGEALLFNPRTKENPGFIYVKPADTLDQIGNRSTTVLIYEARNGKIDPSGAMLYADGRVEMAK